MMMSREHYAHRRRHHHHHRHDFVHIKHGKCARNAHSMEIPEAVLLLRLLLFGHIFFVAEMSCYVPV